MSGPGRVAEQFGGIYRRGGSYYLRYRVGDEEVRKSMGPGPEGAAAAWKELARVRRDLLRRKATARKEPARATLPEFSTPEQLAREWSMTAETIRGLCQRGEMAGARLKGRRWVIHRPTLAASFSAPAAPPPKPGRRGSRGVGPGDLARIASSLE